MEKIISEKKEDIFISYRRKGGEWFAYVIYLKLTDLGYSCFFDKESLRQDFILILPPHALDRCVEILESLCGRLPASAVFSF